VSPYPITVLPLLIKRSSLSVVAAIAIALI
jgi:hypothetical protein